MPGYRASKQNEPVLRHGSLFFSAARYRIRTMTWESVCGTKVLLLAPDSTKLVLKVPIYTNSLYIHYDNGKRILYLS